MKPEFIRTSLKKMWLEDMHYFVKSKFSGESLEIMLDIVNFEADFKALQVRKFSIFFSTNFQFI